MSLLFLLSFLGGGIGAIGIGIGGGAGGDIDLELLILNDPVLWPLSFSVSSLSLSVLLVCGFRSGDVDADDEDFLPKPNFFNVFRLDLSIVGWKWKAKKQKIKINVISLMKKKKISDIEWVTQRAKSKINRAN